MTVRIRARPLGPDGPALTPGQGASTVTALRSGHTVVAQRDLAAELARIDAVLRACPTLFAGEVGASGDWQLESSASGFELLLQLEALGSSIVVEWLAGKPIQVVGTADAQALRLKIYRTGQERPVTVVRLIVRASVEERIMALHRSKRELAADLLEGADAAAKLDDALLALIGSP